MVRRLIRWLRQNRYSYSAYTTGYRDGKTAGMKCSTCYDAGKVDGISKGWQIGYDDAVESVGDWLEPTERE